MQVDDTRLNDRDSIVRVDRQNPIHSLQFDDNPTLDRERATAQPGACAARQKRNAIFIGKTNDRGDLLAGFREDNDIRSMLEQRQTIALVDEQLGFVLDNASRIEDSA